MCMEVSAEVCAEAGAEVCAEACAEAEAEVCAKVVADVCAEVAGDGGHMEGRRVAPARARSVSSAQRSSTGSDPLRCLSCGSVSRSQLAYLQPRAMWAATRGVVHEWLQQHEE